ncbi:MAG: single-stranded-DNA-specific exonuclease RecJ [Pseudomonadales bacterium]|jgi:single-stranded-DNA-specific exonuclease|nr:single-stranded-DNA-specific exonuclease RecJ [Pseudomonadales bacterium]
MNKEWLYKNTITPSTVDEWRQVLLQNRGIDSEEAIKDFFDQKHPYTIALEEVGIDVKQMRKAVTRLKIAIDKKQKVAIFGDYDADGNCATAIIWRGLKLMGLVAHPFIPHRTEHGYGMNERSYKAFREAFGDEQPDLIVSVDNGIVANETIGKFVADGIDVIVTDHHCPDKTLPECSAVVHTNDLCGAGVAWFLIRYLLEAHLPDGWSGNDELNSLLGLVALATITDQVPVIGVNRRLVKAGLIALSKEKKSGMAELMRQAKVDPTKINEYDLGFALGPRINAVGRMANTLDGVRLLCTNHPEKSIELATTISQLNEDRKDLTWDMIDLAEEQIDQKKLPKIIIVAHEQFHEGIIGLIAGRLADKYYRPAIAVSLSGGVAKGSARSIKGVNVTDLLRQTREHLLDVGGHEMAAGFSADLKEYPKLVKKLNKLGETFVDEKELKPRLWLDNKVTLDLLVDPDGYELISALKPHGVGNDQVKVGLTAKVTEVRTIGSEGQHCKLSIVDDTASAIMPVLIWGCKDKGVSFKEGDEIELAATVGLNDFNGKKSLQLVYLDGRLKN